MQLPTLKIRGNIDGFLHTGAQIFFVVWVIVAISVFVLVKGDPSQLTLQKNIALGFLVVPTFISLGIILQTITVDDRYIFYSSNFFPVIKRRVLIKDIASISFKRNFMPIADPTGLSKIIMASTDQPMVGLTFYNSEGKILGGINSKVYKASDIQLVINRIKELNPNLQS